MFHILASKPTNAMQTARSLVSVTNGRIGQLAHLPKDGLKQANRVLNEQRKTLAYKSATLYSKTLDATTHKMYLVVWNTIATIVQDSECDWEKDTFDHEFTYAEQSFLFSSLEINKEVTNAEFPQQ